MQNIFTLFAFLHPSLLPSPFPLVPFVFFKCMLIVQERFILVSCFNQINSLCYLLFITLFPYYSQLTVHCVILSSHIDAMCFNSFHSLSFPLLYHFLFCLPIVLSDTPTNTVMLSFPLSIYIYIHIFTYIHISDHICIYVHIYLIGLFSTYDRKHATFDLLILT
jgi:hypothetical protein